MRNVVIALGVISLLAACSGQGTGTEQQGVSTHKSPNIEAGVVPPPGIGHIASVMTRNLYLGADLTPAITATNLQDFIEATGQILRDVTTNNFPVRAKGLADEIRQKNPDLVGLQECALWRTAPPTDPSMMTVRYDYLQLLLDELNRGPDRYEPVVIEEEFDFEAPADENGIPNDGLLGTPLANAELYARLTMRDVILERVDAGVHVWNPQGGHFTNLLVLPLLGTSVSVTRGWTEVDARVRGTLPFHFVNTHLEAYHPLFRQAQAQELLSGPATSDLPVVLVGDLNSDDDTVAGPDRLAYLTLLAGGFVERSTNDPLSCCINSDILTGGAPGDFNHQVDHVMTNAPDTVQLVLSSVTGLTKNNGYWDSDHAGIYSALRIH